MSTKYATAIILLTSRDRDRMLGTYTITQTTVLLEILIVFILGFYQCTREAWLH